MLKPTLIGSPLGACAEAPAMTDKRSAAAAANGCNNERIVLNMKLSMQPHASASIIKTARAIQVVVPLTLLVFMSSHGELLRGAEANPNGREIYRQQCAKCHGKQGEGCVKGKSDDALHGDWSIDKLTRFIEKTIPEDDPDKINGPEVDAVARYINDTFYSREARARNHPARVETSRLTNRQYVNTVADLLRHFTGDEAPAQGERGLRGNYRSKLGKGDENRKSFDRVDRKVEFSFDAGSADEERLAPAPMRSTLPGAVPSSPTKAVITISSSKHRTVHGSG